MPSARVFLTGASAGIGRATATRLCERGHQVWACARSADRLPTHEQLHPVVLDLADPGAIAPAYHSAEAEAGGFEALVNNAGFAHFAPLLDLSGDALREEFQVMVAGPLQLIQLAAPALGQSGGVVVNVSSLAAALPIPGMGGYSATKAALANLTMTLRMELAELARTTGQSMPRVVDIQPGDIDTGFNDHMSRPPVAATRADWTRATLAACEAHCRGAPGPEVIANAIVEVIERRSNAASPQRHGDFGQVQVAPMLLRLLPGKWREAILRRYYRSP